MNLKKLALKVGLFLTVNTLSFSAYSIESNTIKVGSFNITPTFDIDYSANDNIFLTNNNEVQSNITIINPKVQTTFKKNSQQYFITMEILNGDYSESEVDNYLDWHLSGLTQLELNALSTIDLKASFFSTHEARGTYFSEGNNLPDEPDEPDEYDDFNIDVNYQVGTDNTFARANIDFNYFNRGYNNNRFVTITRDRQSQALAATIYFQALSSIDVLLEYKHVAINYLNDPIFNSLDNDEDFAFIGLEWTTLFNTSGFIKIGQGEKVFESQGRENIESLVWDAGIQLGLFNNSVLSLETQRDFDETKGVGNAIIDTIYHLDWQYNWSDRFNSVLQTSYDDDKFNDSNRKDDTYSFGLQFNYSITRWLDASLTFSAQERNSEMSAYDYQQNLISIGIEVGL